MTLARMKLGTLLHGIVDLPDDGIVSELAMDSRQVTPGAAFLACRGDSHHGLDFVGRSLERGATAVLWEPVPGRHAPEPRPNVVMAAVPHLRDRASELADRFFTAPSRQLAVTGITGTNGKTTCAWLLARAQAECGMPTAYLGTLGAGFEGPIVAGTHTTPDAVTVQRHLADFRAAGARAVAMEVSSHALAQSRVAAVHFDSAVFTNLSRDHLDYHGSMEAYADAKARLFTSSALRLAVCNADDALGSALLARGVGLERIAFSSTPGFAPPPGARYLHAQQARFGGDGLSFALDSSYGAALVEAPLLGEFNVQNLLAVLGVLLGSGVSLDTAVEAVRQLQPPPGRLETLGGGELPLVVVDYAHTPDALAKALQVLRVHCTGRLVCVFGCGGDRDRGKRPLMGAVAAQLADEVILTDDNPRSEAPAAILRDILDGMPDPERVRVIPERAAAIRAAVAAARAGDVVLVAGKGHETEQIVGNERLRFSDVAAAGLALECRARRQA
jgi:UDP-N-acetylmuramoyl-L-alanyl-D-glutamate--2,6-diaminopimelate ligase